MWIRMKLSARLDMCKLQYCQVQHLLVQVCPTTSAALVGKTSVRKVLQRCYELTGGPTVIIPSVQLWSKAKRSECGYD